MRFKNEKGWIVVLGGLGLNLMLGVLYAWSVFGKNLSETHKWSAMESTLPYTVAIGAFATMMLIGGKLQDRFGAQVCVAISGLLVGTGLIVSSCIPSLAGVVVGFGIFAGAGIGMGYSAATPAAVKSFSPRYKGVITGIVVGGFGLAALYIAPLTHWLISKYGVFGTFKIYGFVFGLGIIVISPLLVIPKLPEATETKRKSNEVVMENEHTWRSMLKTKQFYILWLMYFSGSIAGLMVIGHLAKIAKLQTGGDVGYILVAVIAITNALGRPIAGFASDKIGRGLTMMGLFALQGTTLLLFSGLNSFTALLVGASVVTFAYGAMPAVFPAAIGDFYGIRNLGFNYAVLFTAWGVAGLCGPMLAGYILDQTGGYSTAYMVSAGLCYFAAVLGRVLKAPQISQ